MTKTLRSYPTINVRLALTASTIPPPHNVKFYNGGSGSHQPLIPHSSEALLYGNFPASGSFALGSHRESGTRTQALSVMSRML